jgi:hypothetical protein
MLGVVMLMLTFIYAESRNEVRNAEYLYAECLDSQTEVERSLL